MEAHATEPQQQQHSTSPTKSMPSACSPFIARLMTQKRTWVFVSILVYAILLSSLWNILISILSWYESTNPSYMASGRWSPAVYAAVALGAVLGLLSMAVAVAVAMPATVVTWTTVLVLLTFCGKPRRAVEVEGRKLKAEISGLVGRILIKEGNVVAVVCALFGYFALVRRSRGEAGDS